jgi:NADPH:quinone reductase-like Zn-dependent oxidoreductase
MPPGFGPFGRMVFGLMRPRQPILGTELSGVIDWVGDGVRSFAQGDEVFAFANASMGSHAEYRCIAANGLVAARPRNLTFEQAAALSFGGMTMLGFFRRGELKRGQRVLINGASGAVGSAAVQIARHFGAEVTAVCSTSHTEVVQTLGAHHVIDYTRIDFAAGAAEYDVIVDTVGNAPYARVGRVLAPGGRVLAVLAGFADLLRAPFVGRRQRHRVIAGPSAARVEELHQLADIAAIGAFTPLIDRVYPFAQIVEAHRRVDAGHKRGSVVVTLAP